MHSHAIIIHTHTHAHIHKHMTVSNKLCIHTRCHYSCTSLACLPHSFIHSLTLYASNIVRSASLSSCCSSSFTCSAWVARCTDMRSLRMLPLACTLVLVSMVVLKDPVELTNGETWSLHVTGSCAGLLCVRVYMCVLQAVRC